MTGYHLTEAFMAQAYAAKAGVDQTEAAEAVAVFLSISQAMVLITTQRLDAVERDARALQLAGQGVPRVAIALRLGVDRATVFRAIRDHQKARRAALRMAG
jgi:hypothetical protein